jgi:hypothetical protein
VPPVHQASPMARYVPSFESKVQNM